MIAILSRIETCTRVYCFVTILAPEFYFSAVMKMLTAFRHDVDSYRTIGRLSYIHWVQLTGIYRCFAKIVCAQKCSTIVDTCQLLN
jgi:hypothetical protein